MDIQFNLDVSRILVGITLEGQRTGNIEIIFPAASIEDIVMEPFSSRDGDYESESESNSSELEIEFESYNSE